MSYRVVLDGEVTLEQGGERVKFRTRKSLELICYVALHGSVSRAEAARQIWPDLDNDRRSANLRLALLYVRKAAPGLLIIDGNSMKVEAEVVFSADNLILDGIDSPWAVEARAKHGRLATDTFLKRAEELQDLDIAILAREQDIFLQAPRILIAKIWISQGEAAKAAAELRDYVSLVRRHVGIDVSVDVFGKAGLPLPDAQKVPAALFEALTPKEQAAAVLGQCPTWLAGGKVLHARSRIEQVLAIKQSKSVRCSLLTWRARFESEAGEFDRAMASATEAGKLASHQLERIGVETETLRANLMLSRQDDVAMKVENLLEEQIQPELKADICLIGSAAYYYLNKPKEAIRLAALSLAAAESIDSQFKVTSAMGMLAGSFFLAGDFEAAADYAGKASGICDRFGIRAREAHYLGLKGRSQEATGDFKNAEGNYRQGIALIAETDSVHIFSVLVTYLGDLLVKTDRAREGIDWLKKGALARRRSSDSISQSTSNRCIARGYLALGETASADKYARAALALSREGKRDLEIAMNEVVLAEVSFACSRKQDGIEHLRHALPIIEKEHRAGRSAKAEDPIFEPERIKALMKSMG